MRYLIVGTGALGSVFGGLLQHSGQKVAFIGRSNVGKSTLINSLLGNHLARSSSDPGKTIRKSLRHKAANSSH